MQKYRPDIDGLRALAVLAVVVFHAFPHRISGGFVGVDVFFVISGYLISGILMSNAVNGDMGVWNFYRKRINRIFPSLAFVLLVSLGLGWITLFPQPYHQLGADVASGATFSANFSLMGEAGYFDRNAAAKPLLHLWSLAIEEQFYILWPLFLWSVRRAGGRWTHWLAAFTVLSFGCNLFAAAHDPVADFYLPFTRFWELSLGGLLAAFELEYPSVGSTSLRSRLLSIAGAVALAAAFISVSSDGFPGMKALLPVLGSACVIAAGSSAWANRYFLANPVMRWIGTISYPLYLWHWPLLSYARILEGDTPTVGLRICVLATAFAAAALTHYFIENPLRFGSHPLRKMSIALVMMLIAAVLGQVVFLQRGFAHRAVVARNPAIRSGDAGGAGPFAIAGCDIPPARRPRVDGCLIDSREAPRFALIGDSKAGALAPGLFRTSHAGGRWIYMGNNDGKGKYMSTVLLSQEAYPREYALTREMLDTIESQPSIRAVVIADAVRNMYGLQDDVSLDGLSRPNNDASLLDAFDRAVTELIAHGRQVYVVVDNPTLAHPEDCVGRITAVPALNRLLGLPGHPAGCSITFKRFFELTAPYRSLLAALQRRHPAGFTIVPTADVYCDVHADICPMFRRGRLLYGYTDHPSDYAAGLIAQRIDAALERSAAFSKPVR